MLLPLCCCVILLLAVDPCASTNTSTSNTTADADDADDAVPPDAASALMSLDEWKDKVLSSAKHDHKRTTTTTTANAVTPNASVMDANASGENASLIHESGMSSNVVVDNASMDLAATNSIATNRSDSAALLRDVANESSIANTTSTLSSVAALSAVSATLSANSDGVIVSKPNDSVDSSASATQSNVNSNNPILSSASAAAAVAAAAAAEFLKPLAPSSREAETLFDQFNYAAVECGAKVLDANREATEVSSVISRSVDHYMLNECGADMWFAAELCEEIMITAVMLQNAEFFSSMVRHVDLLASNSYPARDSEWRLLARVELANSREPQRFILPSVSAADLSDDNQDHFFKFVKLKLTSHYGTEFYCPLTRFAVHGVTLSHAMSERLQLDSKLVTELQSVIKTVDVPLHPPTVHRRPPMCLREDAALYFQRQCRRENAPLAVLAPSSSSSTSTAATSSASSSLSTPTTASSSSDNALPHTDVSSTTSSPDLDDSELLDASFAEFRAANLDVDAQALFEFNAPSSVPAPRVISPPPSDASPSTARDQIVPLRDVQVKKSTESIFRMLAARVKALEINQTLIDRYLEQLTKKYVQNPGEQREQLADSLRKCNVALAGAERARDRAERAATSVDSTAALEALVTTRVAAVTASLSAQIDALRAESEQTNRRLQFDMVVTAVVSVLLSLVVATVCHLCCSSERRTFRARPLEREPPSSPVATRSPVKVEPLSPISRQRKGSEPAPIGLLLRQVPMKKWAPFEDGVPLDNEDNGVDGDVEDDLHPSTCAVEKRQQE